MDQNDWIYSIKSKHVPSINEHTSIDENVRGNICNSSIDDANHKNLQHGSFFNDSSKNGKAWRDIESLSGLWPPAEGNG